MDGNYGIRSNRAIIHNARALCYKAHKDQYNKFNGEPYQNHPFRVARAIRESKSDSSTDTRETLTLALAYVHDVVEDTDYEVDEVCNCLGLTGEASTLFMDALDAITKRRSESNYEYYRRVKNNDIARVVKVYDIFDNLGRIRNIEDRDTYERLRSKYMLGLDILL